MERDDQQRKIRESEGRGVPPPPHRKTAGLSPSMDSPRFRFATIDALPQVANFMAPSTYGYPFAAPTAATADVAPFEDIAEEPTRSVGAHQFFRRPLETSAAMPRSTTVPIRDLEQTSIMPAEYSIWESPSLTKLPKYFPLEHTNRRIKLEECSFDELQLRLSEGFRIMSVQAKFFNRPASAALLTPENVELYLALWESDDAKEVIVEIQRRRGDTVIFHKYASHILDAASGTFEDSLFTNDEGSLLYLQSAEKILRAEMSRIAPETDMDKESIVALEIVYDLLTKDRRDARKLGLEGVCILVNVRKTILSAAILTSRAVLLGDQTQASQGLHEIIFNIVQNRKIGQDEVMGDYPEDSDDENYFLDDDEEIRDYSPEDKEEITLLFNLALDAMAHALEVVTTFGVGTTESPDLSAECVVDTFLNQTDMLTTFLHILQRAYSKPTNAWLAAKCLRFMCSASPSAAERTVKLGGMQFVENAYHVGVASHAKLESECRLLHGVLAH